MQEVWKQNFYIFYTIKCESRINELNTCHNCHFDASLVESTFIDVFLFKYHSSCCIFDYVLLSVMSFVSSSNGENPQDFHRSKMAKLNAINLLIYTSFTQSKVYLWYIDYKTWYSFTVHCSQYKLHTMYICYSRNSFGCLGSSRPFPCLYSNQHTYIKVKTHKILWENITSNERFTLLNHTSLLLPLPVPVPLLVLPLHPISEVFKRNQFSNMTFRFASKFGGFEWWNETFLLIYGWFWTPYKYVCMMYVLEFIAWNCWRRWFLYMGEVDILCICIHTYL